MMKLNRPTYTFDQVLRLLEQGITGNRELRAKLVAAKSLLGPLDVSYIVSAATGELYGIKPLQASKNTDPLVVGTLTKSELVKLYEQYLVPDSKPARKVYDAILNAAKEQCPFCGGIGTPRNLDHFLPKVHFPQFSVSPYNLVPACRDCNMDGKDEAYATVAKNQIIQPYLDKEHFFKQQWIFARYHPDPEESEPGHFEYYLKPPTNWSGVDKQRVNRHFIDFSIASRYATQAGKTLKTVLSQIRRNQNKGVPDKEVIKDLLEPGVQESPFSNHWQCGMYQALILSLIHI